MTEVTPELVKNALVSESLRVFTGASVYKENKANPSFPHVVIHQLTLAREEQRRGVFILTYSMTLRYRQQGDPSESVRLNSELDGAAMRFMNGFHIVPCGDGYIRCEESRTEKVDGVLHCFCDVKVMARKVADEKNDKMQKLVLHIEGKR